MLIVVFDCFKAHHEIDAAVSDRNTGTRTHAELKIGVRIGRPRMRNGIFDNVDPDNLRRYLRGGSSRSLRRKRYLTPVCHAQAEVQPHTDERARSRSRRASRASSAPLCTRASPSVPWCRSRCPHCSCSRRAAKRKGVGKACATTLQALRPICRALGCAYGRSVTTHLKSENPKDEIL